jgi:hypothetical protein
MLVSMSAAGEATAQPEKVQHELCDLLLDVLCRDTNRLANVRRHVQVTRATMPYMSKAQAEIAEARISKLRTKWGEVLPEADFGPEKLEIPPETMVVDWLAQRRIPEAHLGMMHRSAELIWGGETSLDRIMVATLQTHPRAWKFQPGYDSYREWLFLLRIARPDGPGVYRPGILCEWWVTEMKPSKLKGSSYRSCLEQLTERKRLSWERRCRPGWAAREK